MREDDITRSLTRLLGAQTLSDRVTKQVEAVHDALTRPKRVTVMGPPRSGKSDLMALLAGNRVVSADLSLGTISLVYGEQARTTMEMPDGSKREWDGIPSATTFDGDVTPIKTTIMAPLPALKKISLMRLAEANTIEDQSKAMAWAAGQSDIVIWCTTRFTPVEKSMWALMPERVRDHAFVLRTSLVGFDQNMATARSDLGRRVGDEFAFVLAADLKIALSAQISVPIDKEGMKRSGASTIISTLLKEIEQGRQNAVDQAEVILAKYPAPEETAQEAAQAAFETADPEPATPEPETVAPESEPPAPEPDLQAITEGVREVIPTPAPKKDTIDDVISDLAGDKTSDTAPKPAPAARRKDPGIFPVFETKPDETADDAAAQVSEPVSELIADEAPTLSDETTAMCNDMIVRLAKVGVPDKEAVSHRGMFDAGLETLSWIDEALADVANDDVPQLASLQQKTEEATDLIHLLRLENNDTAALDAVTILLQMKRSVHALLAA